MDKISMQDFEDVNKPFLFSHKPSDYNDKAYVILKRTEKGENQPVGEYVVLNNIESREMSEKKVINLVSVLNGKTELIRLGENTNKRMLYKLLPRENETGSSKIVFYELSAGQGVSKENAILSIEEDIE